MRKKADITENLDTYLLHLVAIHKIRKLGISSPVCVYRRGRMAYE